MKEQFLKFAPLFTGLNDSELEAISTGFVAGQTSTGAKILSSGECSDAIYLIKQGFVRLVSEQGFNLATLGPGSLLGDTSLLQNQRQDVNALAATDVEFWKLTDRKLRELLLQQPSIGLKLSQNAGGMIAQMEDYLVQRLSQIADLSGLPRNTIQAIAAALQPVRLTANQTLYRAGDNPTNLYFIDSGSIETRYEGNAADQATHTPQAGEILGAMAILTQKPYTYTAVARQDSLLWAMPADRFQQVNSKQPGLRRSLSRTSRARLSRTDQGQASLRLAQMPLFAELPPPALQALAQYIVLQHVPAGERVYRGGDSGDALYLIENGEVELSGENAQGRLEQMGRIGAGGYFGEMSLVTGQVRTEDATALRNSNLWVLQKVDLDALSDQYPMIGKALSQGVASKLNHNQPDDSGRFLDFELFSDLASDDLRELAQVLRPTRYRGGETIFRMNAPSDTLYLIERGQVRIQPMTGKSWLLGPGEEFGERSLLTSQPHNASAIADTDVDLWTLARRDYDTLTRRNPNLGSTISRSLNRRLQGDALPDEMDDEEEYEELPPTFSASAGSSNKRRTLLGTQSPNLSTSQPLPATGVGSLQRRQQQPNNPSQRSGFLDWYSNLSGWGKFNAALLILVLIYLLGVAASQAFLRLLPQSSIASGASAYSPVQALRMVYNKGSFDLARENVDAARAIALLDSLAPPTPSWTPPPTATPDPASVVSFAMAANQPTNTPLPTPTLEVATGLLNIPVEQPVVQFVAQVAAVPVAPAPELSQAPLPPVSVAAVDVSSAQVVAAAAPAAPAAPARNWDPRLSALGVTVNEANLGSGQYWKLIDARWEDESQAGGKHHVFVEVLDENGSRIVGQPVTVYWGDGSFTGAVEDKAPPEYGFNYQMYAPGNSYSIKVEGLPSDLVQGVGLGDLERPQWKIHTSTYLLFKKSSK